MSRTQLAAGLALILAVGALILAVVNVVVEFPRGLILLACAVLAAVAAWFGVLRGGLARVAGLACAAVFVIIALALLVSNGFVVTLIVFVALGAAIALAREAFRVHVAGPRVEAPERPVLFMNPRSGGGKAERFHLADEARARGIEAVELRPGDDLEVLVRDAVGRGAKALAMAGGDGSQAIVAAIAAELGLPYACIPAGTRNHFALDLGVDRDDVVGALDAFVDGSERRVDLAEVNGRVFVNNVSLGLYADAVAHEGYRDAKLRTLLDTVPEVAGPEATGMDLQWADPTGATNPSGLALLVSNNVYRLGSLIGSGTRPRIDAGTLGISIVEPRFSDQAASRPHRILREWSAATFDVDSEAPVPAGIDGEAVVLSPPLRFVVRPGVLRVRVARAHPGASPSAAIPDGSWAAAKELARIAAGRPSAGRPSVQS